MAMPPARRKPSEDEPGSRIFRSSDVDETRRIVADIYCGHRLQQVCSRQQLDYVHVLQQLGALSFSEMSYGAEVRILPDGRRDFFLLQIPIAGTDRLQVDGAECMNHGLTASMQGPDSCLAMHWSADCRKFVIRFERRALERHAVALLGEVVGPRLAFPVTLDLTAPRARAWVSTARHVSQELGRDAALAEEGLVRHDLEQMLMTTAVNWLRVDLGSDRPTGAVLPRHVRQAQDYMRAHADLAISVEMLAEVAGVSGRALYDGFQRFLGVSPMRHLRDLRMERARAELLQPDARASVTRIATRWGFFQLGRFAGDYRRRFGESPNETLQRSRPPLV